MRLLPEVGLRLRLTWQTDVIEAYSGKEQRARVASLPRVQYDGAIMLEDADLAYVRSYMATDPETAFRLPLGHETVAALNTITGTSLTIDPTYVDWNVVGRYVYIRGPAGAAYTAQITVVGGGGATLTLNPTVPAGSFPAHLTMVTPLEALLLEDGQGLSRWQRKAGRFELAGRQQTARALGTAGAPAMTTLDSLDVLDRRPVADGMAGEQLRAGVEFQDAGGALASSTAWTVIKPRREFSWLIKGASERQWWKSFLKNRCGRWVKFLAPTWRPDLLLTTFTSGAAAIRVSTAYADYATQWFPSLAHRRVQIEFRDGSFQRRTVLAVVDVGGGVQELVTDGVVTGSPANVVCVSLLEQARLDVDEVSIVWGADAGRVSLALTVIQG